MAETLSNEYSSSDGRINKIQHKLYKYNSSKNTNVFVNTTRTDTIDITKAITETSNASSTTKSLMAATPNTTQQSGLGAPAIDTMNALLSKLVYENRLRHCFLVFKTLKKV